jgi:hypothetical protein
MAVTGRSGFRPADPRTGMLPHDLPAGPIAIAPAAMRRGRQKIDIA